MLQLGIDRLFIECGRRLKGKRVGLLAHAASVNGRLQHTIDIIRAHPSIRLVKLFGPEHGFWGTAQDMVGVRTTVDERLKIPVVSLYGSTLDSLRPTYEDLKGIDTLICDLQDVGSRYYTYIYTMAYCLEACARAGIEIIVLDRPNPINGIDVEGKILKKGFESFVGAYPLLPARHGMTIGEAALFFNEAMKWGTKIHVVKMKGWKRRMFFNETGLPWVNPSPNMPSPNTALVYPGLCLVEATNLSEGRGTTRPFELVGAPFIDPFRLADELKKCRLPGVVFRPTSFQPAFQKWVGMKCQGVEIHVTERKKFRPLLTGVAILTAVKKLFPDDFAWRHQPYEFVSHIPAIDLLFGDDSLRKLLDHKTPFETIRRSMSREKTPFIEKRKPCLVY